MTSEATDSNGVANKIIKTKYFRKNDGWIIMSAGIFFIMGGCAFNFFMNSRFSGFDDPISIILPLSGLVFFCLGVSLIKVPSIIVESNQVFFRKRTIDHLLSKNIDEMNCTRIGIVTKNKKPFQILIGELDDAINTGKARNIKMPKIAFSSFPKTERDDLFNLLKSKGVHIIEKA